MTAPCWTLSCLFGFSLSLPHFLVPNTSTSLPYKSMEENDKRPSWPINTGGHKLLAAITRDGCNDQGNGGVKGQDDQSDSVAGEDEVFMEIEKLGKYSRKIRFKIGVEANLDTIWNVLTNYEKLADIIPSLAVSQLIHKKDNVSRICQIGNPKLPFGVKLDTRFVFDYYEKEIEIIPSGKRRDVEFKMAEGSFQLFEGKWSIEQLDKPKSEDSNFSDGQESFQTVLSYSLDVKTKLWMPVHLVEGTLCKETKANMFCIRQAAEEAIHTNVCAH